MYILNSDISYIDCKLQYALARGKIIFFLWYFCELERNIFLQLIGALSLCIEPVFFSGRRNILLRLRFNKLSLYFAHQIGGTFK